jgi:hypothetical protein
VEVAGVRDPLDDALISRCLQAVKWPVEKDLGRT